MEAHNIVWGRTQESINNQYNVTKARLKEKFGDKTLDRDEYNTEMVALATEKMAAEDKLSGKQDVTETTVTEDLTDGADHDLKLTEAENAAENAAVEDMITPPQVKYLCTLTSAWDDSKLRTWLSDGWGVTSRKALTKRQAWEAIDVAKTFNEAPELTGDMKAHPPIPSPLKKTGTSLKEDPPTTPGWEKETEKHKLKPRAIFHPQKRQNKPEEQDTFLKFEQRDETMIMREMRGGMLQEFIYRFKESGREVVGLSWAGVKECARRMGGIEVLDADISENEQEIRVVVRAKDNLSGAIMIGVSAQEKIITMRSGQQYPDKFALQKAVSKAQRNAIRCLIPEALITEMIKKFMEVKR